MGDFAAEPAARVFPAGLQHPPGHLPPCGEEKCRGKRARAEVDCTHYCTRCVLRVIAHDFIDMGAAAARLFFRSNMRSAVPPTTNNLRRS